MRWAKTDHIAIALSGGVDSIVLYHLLNEEYENTYKSLTVMHVNHGVREESDGEERVLEKLACENGHLFLSTKLDIESFTQQKGRTARYQFFRDMMERHHIDYCLTAHHKDDDIETVLYELLSGRHLYGVGIKPVHDTFLRPMLGVHKKEIKRYADRHKLTILEDASNESDHYTRNYIRHHIVPLIDAHPSLQRDALTVFKRDYLEMESLVKSHACAFLKDKHMHSRKSFNELNRVVQLRVLSVLFDAYIERSFLEECVSVLRSDRAQIELIKDDKALVVSYDSFTVIEKVEEEIIEELVITSPGKYSFNGYMIVVESLNTSITARTRRPGDRITIPNLGTKKVNRVFIDEKVPNDLRDKMPIIVIPDGQIIAVGPIYNIIKSFNHLKFDINLEIKESFHDIKK